MWWPEKIVFGKALDRNFWRFNLTLDTLTSILAANSNRVAIAVAIQRQNWASFTTSCTFSVADSGTQQVFATIGPSVPSLWLPVWQFGDLITGPINATLVDANPMTLCVTEFLLNRPLEDMPC